MMLSPQTLVLPAAMDTRLRQIRRRQWLFGWLQAGALAASVFLLALMAALIIDWQGTLRDTRFRVALTGGTFVLAGWVAAATLWWRLRPLLKTTWAANRVDAAIPQLEERWTTVVAMTSTKPSPTTATARAMLQQVVHEAAAMGRLVHPQTVARPESSFRSLMALAVCIVLLWGFLSLDWPQTSVLLRRFWQPTADITATQLVSETKDVVIPRGEFVDLKTTLTGVPRSQALLFLQRDGASIETVPMTRNPNDVSQFAHRLRVEETFQYQMQAGDGSTAWLTVRAVDLPALAEVQFTVDPPTYVTRPRLEKTQIPGRIKVLQGSRLSLRMRPTTPLARCELALTDNADDAKKNIVSLKANAQGWYHFQTILEADLTLVPHLWDEHGLTNEDAPVCRIQVIPDQAPVARILGSNAEAAVANDDVLKIEFEAHDDQGIAAAQLVVYDESGVENGEPPRILHIQDIPLGNQELQKHVLASLELDLKQFHLDTGSQISYAIRVMDNRMLKLDPHRHAPPLLSDRDDDPATDSTESPLNGRQPGKNSPNGKPPSRGDKMMRDMIGKDDDPDNGDDASRVARNDNSNTTSAKRRNTPQAGDPKSDAMNASEQDGKDGPTNDIAATGDEGLNPVDGETDVVSALFPENVPSTVATHSDPRRSTKTPDDPPRMTPSKRTDGTAESATAPIAVRPVPKNADGTPMTTADAKDFPKPEDTQNAAVGQSRPGSPLDDPSVLPSKNKSSRGKQAPKGDDAENLVNIVVADSAKESDTASKDEVPGNDTTSSTGDAMSSEKEKPTFRMTMIDGQQDTETTRRRIRITERMAAVAVSKERQAAALNVREQVVEIDRRLGAIETGLALVVDRQIPDADRPQHLQQLDQRLGETEKLITNLRSETREGQFAFVGLQMVDIGRTQITPARERVFIAQRETDVGTDRNSTLALQAVLRARELLTALLARYDRVAQDRKLADGLEQSAKMYEIYIEKAQTLMREARQARNPLERKMEIVELEQDYLDRVAEVATLRREMLAEFARVLGDDPRLLSRYLQLSKNRRASLRDQLSQIAERQTEVAEEIRGWLQVQEGQRDDLFNVLVEARLQLATPLAKDAAELAEHIEKQLPLILEPIQGTSARLVKAAQELTSTARDIALDVRRQLRDPDAEIPWQARAKQLSGFCQELEIALDELNFEHERQTEVVEYVTTRLLETRVVADHAARWDWLMEALAQKRFASMAELDQQQIALTTELLRVDMLGIEAGLQTEFTQQGGATVPAEVLELVRQLHTVMEAATFNQTSATFLFSQDRMEDAAAQQTKACDQLEQGEKLFDDIRRKVVAALDELPPRPLNIADLRDPTLDEFLAGLEREPNIEAQLGLPNRRRNLRVIADEMEWQENGAGMMGRAAEEAQQRAMETEQQSDGKSLPPPQAAEREMTAEERQERAAVEQQQQDLAKTLTEMQQRAADPATSPEEKERLESLVQSLQQFAEQSRRGRVPPNLWNQIAQSDQAKAALAAIAAGKKIPDQQWNKLMSSLDDGLLQVGGRTPPAEYRRAIEQYQNRLRRMLDGAGSNKD